MGFRPCRLAAVMPVRVLCHITLLALSLRPIALMTSLAENRRNAPLIRILVWERGPKLVFNPLLPIAPRFAQAFLGLLFLFAACSFDGNSQTGNTPTLDASIADANPDDPDAEVALDVCIIGGYDVCHLTARAPLSTASPFVFDTDTSESCSVWPQLNGPDACLVYTESVTVTANGSLSLVGSRPLILVSRGNVNLFGEVSVSSVTTAPTGAGANGSCLAPVGPEDDDGGAGGAAGGSFSTAGGQGGVGDTNDNGGNAGPGMPGLSSPAETLPGHIRGGCVGDQGGDGIGNNGGLGGGSGGGLSIASLTTISNQFLISANGAGGGGGEPQSGGGGGGSGGMIRLAAPMVSNGGTIVAHGGGGGGGGLFNSGTNPSGTPGEDGNDSATPAQGGNGGGVNGDGGNGSSINTGDSGTDAESGGGGGGGGAGFIVIDGTLSGGGLISPSPI